MFECLVPTWWNYLGEIRRYGLVGGEASGDRLRSQQPPTITRVLCPLHMDQDVSFQLAAPPWTLTL